MMTMKKAFQLPKASTVVLGQWPFSWSSNLLASTVAESRGYSPPYGVYNGKENGSYYIIIGSILGMQSPLWGIYWIMEKKIESVAVV